MLFNQVVAEPVHKNGERSPKTDPKPDNGTHEEEDDEIDIDAI